MRVGNEKMQGFHPINNMSGYQASVYIHTLLPQVTTVPAYDAQLKADLMPSDLGIKHGVGETFEWLVGQEAYIAEALGADRGVHSHDRMLGNVDEHNLGARFVAAMTPGISVELRKSCLLHACCTLPPDEIGNIVYASGVSKEGVVQYRRLFRSGIVPAQFLDTVKPVHEGACWGSSDFTPTRDKCGEHPGCSYSIATAKLEEVLKNHPDIDVPALYRRPPGATFPERDALRYVLGLCARGSSDMWSDADVTMWNSIVEGACVAGLLDGAAADYTAGQSRPPVAKRRRLASDWRATADTFVDDLHAYHGN